MAEKNRFSKPVAFNKSNERDQKILKHVEGVNFSGYVKDLIVADMEGRGKVVQLPKDEIQANKNISEAMPKIVHKSDNGGIKIVLG